MKSVKGKLFHYFNRPWNKGHLVRLLVLVQYLERIIFTPSGTAAVLVYSQRKKNKAQASYRKATDDLLIQSISDI